MVKDFLRKLVAIVAILFFICLVFCPAAAIFCSNEIVKALFQSKAVWLFALLLTLSPPEKNNIADGAFDKFLKTEMERNLYEIQQDLYEFQQAENDDETLSSPK